MSEPVSPEQYPTLIAKNPTLYVWGEIKYRDWTREPMVPRPFCQHAAIKQILDALPGDPEKLNNPAVGYFGPSDDCSQ
jgi:hypothetical protein